MYYSEISSIKNRAGYSVQYVGVFSDSTECANYLYGGSEMVLQEISHGLRVKGQSTQQLLCSTFT